MCALNLDHWANLWRSQMLLNIKARGNLDCTQYWETKEIAQEYDQKVRENGWQKPLKRVENIEFSSTDRIIDVGAGTGALAIPLSKRVREIIAVEPAENMLWCLKKNIAEEKISNVTCINKRWEDVDIKTDLKAPCDILIASYSLGMTDIVGSLKKMNATASKGVYLFWFAENAISYNNSLLGSLAHQQLYAIKPQSDILFNVLFNLGFNPNIRISTTTSQSRFKTVDEVISMKIAELSFIGNQTVAMNAVKKYLEKHLVPDKDSFLLTEDFSEATIWWKPKNEQAIKNN
jgi:hypothetical protein